VGGVGRRAGGGGVVMMGRVPSGRGVGPPPAEARVKESHMSPDSEPRRAFLAGTTVAGLPLVTARGGLVTPASAAAVGKVGEAAPAFTIAATTGKDVSLADQRDKIVVLEWTNHDCPYVRKHYES